MAESPSSALPGGVEWLPALGGALLLRAEVGRGDPPALVLQSLRGGEHRIEAGPEARFSRSADFLVPAGLPWSRAALQWPDGTRAVLPEPPEGRADVIHLPTRRAEPREPVAPQPLPWTAPPWSGPSDAEGAAAAWRIARAGLQLDLKAIADAVTRAQASERATGDAVLDVIAGARTDLQAARAQAAADARLLAAAEHERQRREADELAGLRAELAKAHAEIAELRAALEAERAARVEPARHVSVADLRRHAAEQAEAAKTAPRRPDEDTGRLLAALEAAAGSLRAAIPPADDAEASCTTVVDGNDFLRTAAAAEPSFAAGVDESDASPAAATAVEPSRAPTDDGTELSPVTAAEALSAAVVDGTDASPTDTSAELDDRPDEPPSARAEAAALAPDASVDPPPAAPAPAPIALVAASAARPAAAAESEAVPTSHAPAVPPPGLRRALVALAREDSLAAGALLAGLLPVHGALLAEDLSYDLTVRGHGTFAVTVRGGTTDVRRLARRRPRRQAAFHLAGDPPALAALLAGERNRLGRFTRGARVIGRRRRVKALNGLVDTSLSLAEVARLGGAQFEPGLVYTALPFAIPPQWTRGHVFTVAQEIVELKPRAWHITARDGVRLSVAEHAAGAAADATVTMSRAAFDRLLRGEPAAAGDRPQIRGDHAAVATLKRWTDLARGA